MTGHAHHCSDTDALITYAALCRWSGDRGRVYPIDVRIRALRLLGRAAEANALAAWIRLEIPVQRAEDVAAQRSRIRTRHLGRP